MKTKQPERFRIHCCEPPDPELISPGTDCLSRAVVEAYLFQSTKKQGTISGIQPDDFFEVAQQRPTVLPSSHSKYGVGIIHPVSVLLGYPRKKPTLFLLNSRAFNLSLRTHPTANDNPPTTRLHDHDLLQICDSRSMACDNR